MFHFSPLQSHLSLIVGPAFHELAPEGLCFSKPRPQQMMHLFNLLAEAFLPNQDLLTSIYKKTTGGTKAAALQMLDFFQFFLPLVPVFRLL